MALRLESAGAVLRPLTSADAAPLVDALAAEDVARFLHAPPASEEAFRRYVDWASRERRAGRHLALAVVPRGHRWPVGLFQIRRPGPTCRTADWGFAFGTACWGSGLFMQTAPLVVRHAIETLGVHRLEARAVVCNGRGNGALAKIGAVCEAVLRESFDQQGRQFDEHLWAIVGRSWLERSDGKDRRRGLRLLLSPTSAK